MSFGIRTRIIRRDKVGSINRPASLTRQYILHHKFNAFVKEILKHYKFNPNICLFNTFSEVFCG